MKLIHFLIENYFEIIMKTFIKNINLVFFKTAWQNLGNFMK